MYRILKWFAYAIYLTPFVLVILANPSAFFQIIAWPCIFFIILFGPFSPYTSRVIFGMKLKRVCRRAKLRCKFHHGRMTSFWRRYEGFDVEISDRRGGELYSLKFFHGNMDEKGVHLRSDSCAEIIRYLVAPRLGRRHAMGRSERTERSRTLVDYHMSIAQRGESILLFSPSPYTMSVLENNKIRPAGNGENYMGFRIYTARGFLDYIKRKEL